MSKAEAREAAFAVELRKWWSFDNSQIHTHSWHSREDFIRGKLPSLLKAQRAAVWREAEQIAREEAEKMRAAENHPTTELDAVGRYAARWVTAADIADAIAARAKEERGE